MSALTDGGSNRADIRLESWKQIAAHVNRHVTTVRRWEKHEGLPVHRHVHSALSSVYAYASELDAWMNSRQPEEPLGFAVSEMPRPGAVRPCQVATPLLTSALSTPVPLLGRDSEYKTLREVWHAASAGQQQIALITGETGAGKTRLAFEFARLANPEATILTGVCDREALFPFAPFVAMLRSLTRAGNASTLQRLLNEIAGSGELAQLVPEITKATLRFAPELQATAESRRFRMFDAFAQLVAALSRDRPMLLLFEDVHWADAGSLLFLRHLIHSTRNAALCLLITYRENEPDHGAFSEETLHDLQREFGANRIRLHGLATAHIHCFVDFWTENTATPQLKDWIATLTEGNPLFITEMLTHLAETVGYDGDLPTDSPNHLSLPEGIRHVIRRRFARLSPASKKLLTLGAIIGREFSLPLMEALVDMPEDELLDGIEEALRAKVVGENLGVPGRFSFTHALIRETLYADTMAARRARLHHRIGIALERQQSPQVLPLAELAYHFGEGAIYDAEKAIEYAVRAGDYAYNGLALEEAARHYGQALRALSLLSSGPLQHSKRIELHTLRGRSFFQVCQWKSAKTEFEAALSLLNPEDLVKRCELLVRVAEASFWLMEVPALRRFANEAELLADVVGRDDLWAEARAWTASAKVADGDVLGGVASDRHTLARVGEIHSFGLARVPLTLYWAGHTAEAATRAQQAVEGARSSGDPAFLLYALQHLGICFSGCGRYDEALQAFAEACAFGRQCGASSLLARATSMSVAPLFSLGDFAGATNRAMEARELARRVAFEPALVSAGIDLLLIYARTEDPGKAEPLLIEVQQAVDKAGGWHAWKWRMRLCQARAELALSRGEWTRAITFASDAIEQSTRQHRPKYQALALTVRAQARRELGLRNAINDARAAVDVARRLADPVLLTECLSVLLLEQGTDELIAESQQAIDNVFRGLADESLRLSFLARLRANKRQPRSRKPEADAVRTYA